MKEKKKKFAPKAVEAVTARYFMKFLLSMLVSTALKISKSFISHFIK